MKSVMVMLTLGIENNISVKQLAELIFKLLKSDRDVNIAVGGFTGEGKSTFLIKLIQAYCKLADIPFTFEFLTWSREEMMTWIDGKGPEHEGRRAEYYPIVPDELFKMFYKRLWYEKKQIDAIGVLNMCRDRHLLIAGAIPNFWNLDKSFITRIRFYVYITIRGEALIFQQENNPFSTDVWNVRVNEKIFRRGNIERSPNFLFKVHYDDLDEDEKAEYLAIRNKKRLLYPDEPEEEEKQEEATGEKKLSVDDELKLFRLEELKRKKAEREQQEKEMQEIDNLLLKRGVSLNISSTKNDSETGVDLK